MNVVPWEDAAWSFACEFPEGCWRASTESAAAVAASWRYSSVVCVHPRRFRRGGPQLPCGKCVECGLLYSRMWAVRCMHEAEMHLENSFVTLTLSEEFLPRGGSLDGPVSVAWSRGFQGPGKPGMFAQFMKRLRERRARRSVKYFHAGEYGEKNDRPHYHALLFGVGFPDRVLSGRRDGLPVWRSAELEELWPFGRAEIGSVTFESAQYVAKYCVKKRVRGGRYSDGYREPEYITMSRRPGIGADWIRAMVDTVAKFGTVMHRGVELEAPRFYMDRLSEAQREVQKARRERKYGGYRDDEWRECAAREVIAVAKLRMAEEAL